MNAVVALTVGIVLTLGVAAAEDAPKECGVSSSSRARTTVHLKRAEVYAIAERTARRRWV
jgi:hypothetical protein